MEIKRLFDDVSLMVEVGSCQLFITNNHSCTTRAHPLITIPTSLILSLYPFGIQSSHSFLTTQTNGSLDSSIPSAISLSCSIENRLPLPKHMYTTEPVGLLSIHFKHLLTKARYSPPLVDLLVTSLLH
ncbi:hypothetical protein IEQ34_006928 [Dendrobium chrysotoxum]|uniref:Uncharacterized protein n=1 Tax=Dendrobium chrysotoxum TaxID=161865 RepID=A0AAV7H5F0_DENCH|nr:hypothetical protein IEQ34_006928 [Dendrobium chrysotoxum]